MSDVLSGTRQGRCPMCDSILRTPEEYIDSELGDSLIEGAASYWCPACGWEEDDPRAGDTRVYKPIEDIAHQKSIF